MLSWFPQFLNLLQQLWDTIANLFAIVRDAVLEALSLAFDLDPAYMEAQFNSLISEFKFFGSMVDFGKSVVDVFYGIGSKPPVLYIDLSAAEGSVFWGERVIFLDLTWYSRYKPYGDALISSFLWAFFGWRLLHHIPGLINGSSGIVPHFK